MKHVFISYVREDQETIDRLCKELRSRGVKVWLDRDEILPGQHWRESIRSAIRDGAFFIACFSEHYSSRGRSYMNEELTLAVEEIRLRGTNITWFIPVRLSESKVPDRSIGGGETLLDLQWVDLFSDWHPQIKKILYTMGISPLSELEEYMSELSGGLLIDQWQLLARKPSILRTNVYYALKNIVTQKSIECGYVKRGIQLVWGPSFQHVIAFRTPDAPTQSDLRFADKIAIHMKDKGYIICKGRGYGINLAFSQSPAYQWIIGPVENGNDVLSSGDKFSIFNTIEDDCLVHFPRSNGVSLRWKTDCRWGYDGHAWSKAKLVEIN